MDAGAPFVERKDGILRVGVLREGGIEVMSAKVSASLVRRRGYGCDTAVVSESTMDEHGDMRLRSILIEMWIWF